MSGSNRSYEELSVNRRRPSQNTVAFLSLALAYPEVQLLAQGPAQGAPFSGTPSTAERGTPIRITYRTNKMLTAVTAACADEGSKEREELRSMEQAADGDR